MIESTSLPKDDPSQLFSELAYYVQDKAAISEMKVRESRL